MRCAIVAVFSLVGMAVVACAAKAAQIILRPLRSLRDDPYDCPSEYWLKQDKHADDPPSQS
ncbi:MAG TPA: hypothetical protein VG013_23675 [Gemmataceae bacterium]|jgi:hypothetical protein|nr:hypothetical protein [Gemmataceae bacterium]